MATHKTSPRILTDPKGRVYVNWYDASGKRHRTRAPLSAPDQQAWAADFLTKLSEATKAAHELREALRIRATKPNFGESAMQLYRAALNRYELAGQDIDRMIEKMKIDGLKPTSISNYLRVLKSLYFRAVDYGLLPENPMANYAVPAPDSRRKIAPTSEERDRILAHLKEVDRELYLLTAIVHYSFIRCTEILRLTPEDYDFSTKSIHVMGHASKTKKQGTVVMIKPLRDILNGQAPTFNKNIKTYRMYFKREMEKIGLPYTLYSLKHTGASLMIDAGATITQVRDQCRHANIATTDRYLRSLGIGNDKLAELSF